MEKNGIKAGSVLRTFDSLVIFQNNPQLHPSQISCNILTSLEKNLNSIGVRDGVGGQGQYRLGRGSIGWARAVSAVPLPKSDFQHIKKVF